MMQHKLLKLVYPTEHYYCYVHRCPLYNTCKGCMEYNLALNLLQSNVNCISDLSASWSWLRFSFSLALCRVHYHEEPHTCFVQYIS